MSETGVVAVPREILQYQEPVGRSLANQYQAMLAYSRGETDDVVHEQDAMMADLAGTRGKRLRGALLIATYVGFGGTDEEVALKAAVALEESQMALLAFDDFMDRSPIRRDQPTPHVRWGTYIRNQAEFDEDFDADHLANSLAVNTANVLTHQAILTLSNLPRVPADRIVRAIQIHAGNMVRTGEGQARDLVNPLKNDLTEQEIEQTYIDKTAHYTFINPMQVGACLAGAGETDLRTFADLGEQIGLAFQYKDDLLGMFGQQAETGKPVFEDLEEGKMTLLLHYIMHNATEEEKLAVTALRGKHISESQQQVVRHILRRKRGVDSVSAERYVEEKAQASVETARSTIEDHPQWNPEFTGFLHKLLSYVILRNS